MAGFLEKNRDDLRPDLEDLIARSGNQVSNTVQVLVSIVTLILRQHGSETLAFVPNKTSREGQIDTINRYLYNNPSYSCILIGSRL